MYIVYGDNPTIGFLNQ